MATPAARARCRKITRFVSASAATRGRCSTGQSRKFAEAADLVIALGCSFRQHATSGWLPKPASVKLVQVDIDPAELHKNYSAIW